MLSDLQDQHTQQWAAMNSIAVKAGCVGEPLIEMGEMNVSLLATAGLPLPSESADFYKHGQLLPALFRDGDERVALEQRLGLSSQALADSTRVCINALASAPACVSSNRNFMRMCKAFHNRKNLKFCWTELGSEHIGIIQSLITTCATSTRKSLWRMYCSA